MTTMKNTLTIIALLIIPQLFAQPLKLASDVWPPFTDKGENMAIALDLVNVALAKQDIDVETEINSFQHILKNIQDRSIDGSAALWKTPEREAFLIYSNPYLENKLILVGRSGTQVNQKSFKDLEGKSIGLVEDYAYDSDLLENPKIEKIFSTSDQKNLELLIDEKIDYLLVDALLVQYLLKNQMEDAKEKLAIGKNPITVKPLYFAIHKDLPHAEEIIEKFNNEIETMIADGTYHELLGLNWVEADLNHDGIPELYLEGDAAGEAPPEDSYEIFHNPQDTNNDQWYHIDGKIYKEWEDVPDKYKKEIQPKASDNDNLGGIRFKL